MTLNLTLGLHRDIPAATYHADDLCEEPTLSGGYAKLMLDATPRHVWWSHPRLGNQVDDDGADKFALGKVAHEMILGRGEGFAVLDHANYTTKAAKEDRNQALALGMTPILAEQHDRASKLSESALAKIRDHAGFEHFMHPDHGASEVVGIWRDPGGPLCRCMFDWLSRDCTTVVDIKTTGAGLNDEDIARTIETLRYDMGAAFYQRCQRTLFPELIGRLRYVWAFVETDEPHEVRMIEATGEMLAIGDRKAALAIAKWDRAVKLDQWPGYGLSVERASYPPWGGERKWMEREQVEPMFDDAVVLNGG